MEISRRAAGYGLLTYALAGPVAFIVTAAPGGAYSDHLVRTYIAGGHWVPAFIACYLGAAGALGLLVFGTRWHADIGPTGELLRGLAIAGAATSVVGWFLDGGVVVSMAEGGHAVQHGVPHVVLYTLTETGNLLAICAPAFFLGVGAILMAARVFMPRWLKAFSVFAGVCGILAPLYFTYGVFALWALVFSGWVIAGARRTTAATQASPALV